MADPRVHGTVKEVVTKRFQGEAPHLNPLSPLRFDTRDRETRRVALDAMIDVRGNRYSVPAPLVGGQVAIRLTLDGHLKIYDTQEHGVAEHRLCASEQGWQIEPRHHARLWQASGQVPSRDLKIDEEAASCN